MADITITGQAARNLQDYAEHHATPYLRPLHGAMAAGTISAQLVFRDTVGAQLYGDVPTVLVFFDALDGGTGPAGFHKRLLDDVVGVAAAVIVVSHYGNSAPYEDAVAVALKSGGPVLLAETTEARAGEWLALSKPEQDGGRWMLWSTLPLGSA